MIKAVHACFTVMLLSAYPTSAEPSEPDKPHGESDGSLTHCPNDSIRCLEYSDTFMMIDFEDSSVITFRKTPTAVQNYGRHNLTAYQVTTLKNLITKMPASVISEDDDEKCVFIAFHHEGKLQIRKYLMSALPWEAKRIFDIGRDYVKTTTDQSGADQPDTNPASRVPAEVQPPTQPSKEGTR